jgi:magnesium chelatase subunit D
MSKQTKRQAKADDAQTAPPVFPFTALVGQEEMQLALLLNVVEPKVGGVLIMGARGTGKTTAVRGLARLLPPLVCVRGCAYNCDPDDVQSLCADCRAQLNNAAERLPRERKRVPVVELPLNATEDRVCGTISFERALAAGVKKFEPGLLANANRGFLYIDEVNLLEDHLVDLLLDAAATGLNRVEREGVSAAHPARFVLVGSGNPEEGELRPQLLDRFGLFVAARTPASVAERAEVVARHEEFAHDLQGFLLRAEMAETQLRRRIARARRAVARVELARPLLMRIAELCQRLQLDGHRGELTIARAARALAAFEGRKAATDADVRRVAPLALAHRLRRDPLEQTTGSAQLEQASKELFGAADAPAQKQARTSESADADLSPRDDDDEGDSMRRQPRVSADGRAGETRNTERAAPPNDAQARLDLAGGASPTQLRNGRMSHPTGRRQAGVRAGTSAPRGRYVRADARVQGEQRIAFDATLRAAASRQRINNGVRALDIARTDLRFKQFARRAGTLFIFAVDTSGSMAQGRIAQAKGALARLLRQSYVNRDTVALIAFRERSADVLLRPSRSIALARRRLDALPVGGATPLASALLRAYELARQTNTPAARIRLLVFTDGRANVPLEGSANEQTRTHLRVRIERELAQLGNLLRRAGVTTYVLDARPHFAADDACAQLARTLGGTHVPLTTHARTRSDELTLQHD